MVRQEPRVGGDPPTEVDNRFCLRCTGAVLLVCAAPGRSPPCAVQRGRGVDEFVSTALQGVWEGAGLCSANEDGGEQLLPA